MNNKPKLLRDVLIEGIYHEMKKNKDIFFLSADFGAPMLDKLRADFSDRFINVGIAEQNLINVSTGLALEGFKVYAYGIAPFLIMRAYEQIRINLALLSALRPINVNLIGVGIGLSYDVSGPTHHCLEDVGIIRTLPNIELFSPSDAIQTEMFVKHSLEVNRPKYIRLDGKPLDEIYAEGMKFDVKRGFFEIKKGKDACIISTGYMTHKALRVANELTKENINVGVVDVFMIKPLSEEALLGILSKYKVLLTLEEGFTGKGGLDCAVMEMILKAELEVKFANMGFGDSYVFEIGDREDLHRMCKLSDSDIVTKIKGLMEKSNVR